MPMNNNAVIKRYTFRDNVFSFEGAVSVQEEENWVSPCRIQWKQGEFYPFLWGKPTNNWSAAVASQCSGIRLCFSTNADTVLLELENEGNEMKMDLYVDGSFREGLSLDKSTNIAVFEHLGDALKKIEIWLDQRQAFHLKSVGVNEGARICKTEIRQKKWVHYGSSISHSREANTPSGTWASMVARKLDLHLTSFGFAANCIIEPMVGRLIRDLPADYITLKLGVNVHAGRLTQRSFAPNVIGLLQIIREKHPDTPIALISPIFSPLREAKRKVEDGLSLEEMRESLCKIVESCKKYGDRNIYYVDGLKIFGPEELKFMPDELHPNSEGQQVMADHFIKEVFEIFPA